MYQKKGNMFQHNGWLILSLVFALAFSLTLSASGDTDRTYCGPDVESIYQTIRHSSPEYEGTETIVTFENEGMTLVCTLTIPNTPKKAPIIITLNGFTGDRNDVQVAGTNERYYPRLSRILAENGLASLRIDFRGSGDSDGEFGMTTFSTQIADTLAALDYITHNLKHQVDTNSIGIIGFSQGAIIAPVVAAKDKRVDSLVLWSAPAYPPYAYERLLTQEGIARGLALPEGNPDTFGLYFQGQFLYNTSLGKGFFKELFTVNPITEISKYKGPVMVVAGLKDPIVWPQPTQSEALLKYHDGFEKLVSVDADHSYNYWEGPEKLDDVIFWSTAWFMKTLK